jgi:ribosome-associated heat shock protein Hsp15
VKAVTQGTGDSVRVRLDKWLWAARFFKTRALAAEAIDAGRVEVNDERAKRSRLLATGDLVRVRRPPHEQTVKVLLLSESRGPASVAAGLYSETPESARAREALAAQLRAAGPSPFRDQGDGRPSKRHRRELDRWRGRDS